MRLYIKQFNIKKINEKNFIKEINNTIIKHSNTITKHSNKYFKVFKIQLKKSERYLKYLSYNYRPESKALYANIKYLSYEEVLTRLIKKKTIKKN